MSTPRLAHRLVILVAIAFVGLTPALAQEPVDQEAVTVLRRLGLEESQVMDHLFWLTEVHGPRLTGSPKLDDASRWAVDQLEAWGLANVRLEPWGPFGRGWTLERFSMHVTAPTPFPVLAYPKAWSPSTGGPVSGDVVIFSAETEEELAQYRGKLAGKIVLLEEPRTIEEPFEGYADRRDAEDLLRLANAAAADVQQYSYSADAMRRLRMRQLRVQFLYDEKPLAILDRSYKGEYGTVFVSGATVPVPPEVPYTERPSAWNPKGVEVIPQFTVATEHYNHLYRLIEKGFPVQMTLDLAATYHDDDPMEYNVLAEIPGTDPAIGDEVVMLGAHLDSWHAGTGTTDNGAGSAVMMEVMRILQAFFQETGKAPRRTIRLALWTGEEQGLHGSRAYVDEHFADLGEWGDGPTNLKPAHEKFSAYYNLDNGTGKIRGVFLQGNEGVRTIFAAWLAPFNDLGASTVTISNTGGTDHLPFNDAGLPGFQFIQDPIAYSTRTHHSNMDTYDHAVAEDLKQAATVIASFVYHTAQRDERLPRKPLQLEAGTAGTR